MKATIKDWKARLKVIWWVLRGRSVMWRMWLEQPSGDAVVHISNMNPTLVYECHIGPLEDRR